MNYQTQSDSLPKLAGPPGDRRRRVFRVARFALVGALLVGVSVWAADWLRATLLYVHETDARIVADMVSISSRVAGWVVEIPATTGRRVAANDVLARIDTRDAELKLIELNAELAGLDAERQRVKAEYAMVDRRTKSRYSSERSKLAAALALVESLDYEVKYANTEHQRADALFKRGVIPAKDLDRVRTAHLKATQGLLRAKAQAATANASLAEADAERQQLEVLNRELARLDHRETELQARVDRQKLDVADRAIASPLDGVVSKTFVAVGEYVVAGQRIAMLHDPTDIWIEANIRETEIRRLKVGQTVEIVVDAYPDRPFEGRVERIGHATTSEFALLPSPNPSGNFTKITQRLTVKIAVDQQADLLKPGMMVEVFVNVRDH